MLKRMQVTILIAVVLASGCTLVNRGGSGASTFVAAPPGCDGPRCEPSQQPKESEPFIAPSKPTGAIVDPMITMGAQAFFDFAQVGIKPAARAALDELANKILRLEYLGVVVATGHTDSIGSAAYNQRLSKRRAEAVKAYLVSRGIEHEKIYTEGKGKSQPIATNATPEGRAKNRRVAVEVVGLAHPDGL